MNVFQFFITWLTCKRTNNAKDATHHVKLGKERQGSSKRNYYIISLRVISKANIIIIFRTYFGRIYITKRQNLTGFLAIFSCKSATFFCKWLDEQFKKEKNILLLLAHTLSAVNYSHFTLRLVRNKKRVSAYSYLNSLLELPKK